MNTIRIKKIKLNPKGNLIKHHKHHNFYEGFKLSSKKINFALNPRAIFTAFISTSSISGFESQKIIETKIDDYKIIFENDNQLIINKSNRYINLSISFSSLIDFFFIINRGKIFNYKITKHGVIL